jgi:hypothetical protein
MERFLSAFFILAQEKRSVNPVMLERLFISMVVDTLLEL